MSYIRTRGISLVRSTKVSVPNRKEPQIVQKQYMARCNASIPFTHKDFQNQYLYENNQPEEPIRKPLKHKPSPEKGQKKLAKWKKELL